MLTSEFQQLNPFRNPSWRHQRVAQLVERSPRGNPSRRGDDDSIRQYNRFLKQYRDAATAEAQDAVLGRFIPIALAYNMHFGPDVLKREVLQARILAGQDDYSIYSYSGLPLASVDWYEKLYFNVRDRLPFKDYIFTTVLRDFAIHQAPTESDVAYAGMLYKLFGYFGGPVVLDAIIFAGTHEGLPTTQHQVHDWMFRCWERYLLRKSTIAARVFQVNRLNVMQLFDITARLKQAYDDRIGHVDTQRQNLGANVHASLTTLPWLIGQEALKNQIKSLQPFAETAAELRAEETLLISNDQTITLEPMPGAEIFVKQGA